MYILGLDFGTHAVRASIVRDKDRRVVGRATTNYASGSRGVLLDERDPLLARQDPADYVLGLTQSVRQAVKRARKSKDFTSSELLSIEIRSTASSPIPVDRGNLPLAFRPEWRRNLNACCWLWQDRTSWREAERITLISARERPAYIAQCGPAYPPEWFWAKIWHCRKVAPEVFAAAYSWVELADWIPSLLAEVDHIAEVKRGVGCAGLMAMYSDFWGGLPDKEFLRLLDPALAELRDRLHQQVLDSTHPAGVLSAFWAGRLGLTEGIPIAMGEMDGARGTTGGRPQQDVLMVAAGTSTHGQGAVSPRKQISDGPGTSPIVPWPALLG